MKTHPHTPESHSTNEVGASDLTTVEFCGSKSASRTAFGLVGPFPKRFWTAIDVSCRSLPAASSLSCAGRPTTLGPSISHRYPARRGTGTALFDRTLDHARR